MALPAESLRIAAGLCKAAVEGRRAQMEALLGLGADPRLAVGVKISPRQPVAAAGTGLEEKAELCLYWHLASSRRRAGLPVKWRW